MLSGGSRAGHKWEVERPMIAKKVVEKEVGFGFGDAWAAFLAGDAS